LRVIRPVGPDSGIERTGVPALVVYLEIGMISASGSTSGASSATIRLDT